MPIGRRTLSAFSIALFVFACSKSSVTPTRSAKPEAMRALPAVDMKGPISGMVMASSIDAKGRPVNPRFTFSSDEPQLTLFVQTRKITDSPLSITWFRTSDDGDQKLFDQTVEGKSWDRAFSIGKNQGRLAAGSYKVALRLEGHTSELHFNVVAKASQSAQGAPPTSGGSGIAAQLPAPTKAKDSHPQNQNPAGKECSAAVVTPGPNFVDEDSATVTVLSFTDCEEINGAEQIDTITPIGTMDVRTDGKPTRVPVGLVDRFNRSDFRVDPCALDHGSDLPGTKLTFKGVSAENPSAAYEMVMTLGEDTLGPEVQTHSSVKRGSKVKAGDAITFDVTALEIRNGGPWQTGVRMIQITSPGGIVGKPWTNPANLPKPCEEKTWYHDYQATYTVPKNPPETIRICVIAEDYVGNEGSRCGEFLTGDAWQGMIKVKAIGNVYDEEGELALAFTVSGDGSLKGKAHFHRTASRPHLWYINHCTFTQKYAPDEGDLLITGRREGDQFTLNIDPRAAMGIMTSSSTCPDLAPQSGSVASNVLGPLAGFAVHPIVVEAKDGAMNHFLHETFNDIATDATIKINRVDEKSSPAIPVGP
jgi:hypothetical protein